MINIYLKAIAETFLTVCIGTLIFSFVFAFYEFSKNWKGTYYLIKNIKEIREIKNYIKIETKKLIKEYNLPDIKILCPIFYNNACYDCEKRYLKFGLIHLFEYIDIFKYPEHNHVDVETFQDKIDFVIGHEVGHYWQRQKHPRWTEIYSSQYNAFHMDLAYGVPILIKYKDLKLENNASHFSSIVLKRKRKNNDTIKSQI